MANSNTNTQGQGWHGDSKGHAKAGEQSSGKFKSGDKRTEKAAQAGGEARGEQMHKEATQKDKSNSNQS